MRPCIIVPHYDHVPQFRGLLPRLTDTGLPLIVVDDSSPEREYRALQALMGEAAPGATLLRHEVNQGKGGAVMSGLRAAMDGGFSHAIQIDADGQHDVGCLPDLLEAATAEPAKLICGDPVFDSSISPLRRNARKITRFLCRCQAMTSEIRDALCGFRIYPLETIVPLLNHVRFTRRMAFDPEILVRASWAGIGLRYVPVRVTYPEGGRSHFRYLRDNLEISWMHTRLLLGMLIRLPRFLRRDAAARQD